ncbi:MAG: VOC family protein [Clostridia bacterium]|nr:VOC family protein [Clostridia bacterium]
MKRLTKGIHHIALKCDNVEHFNETVHFYHDLYGMEIVRTWTTGEQNAPCMMLDTGAGVLEICANGVDRPGQGALRHIALEVDSVDECIEIARNAGYRISIEPRDICFNSEPPYPARMGFCIGPVGEEVEFFELR